MTFFKYMKHLILISTLVLLTFFKAHSQNKFTIDGYISEMGSSLFLQDSNNATWDYILHNRINMAYYANNNFTMHLQFRNQFLWGETIDLTPNYAENFAKDRGYFDLSWNWFHTENTLLNSQIDRAYIEYMNGNFEILIGRQRINWGRSLVWNPNDIFNAYSYYDFDYMEKPGADALRAIYYTGMASSIEFVTKIDSANNLTIAGLTKFNKQGYDIQLLGGYFNSEDYVIGAGWEGSIKSVAFRGELTYYHPENDFTDTSGVFLASVGVDYSFTNSFMIQAEFLYNDPKTLASSLIEFYSAPVNSKSLSISEYNFFVNCTYPVTPIFSVYVGGMYYTDQKGYFLMPGFDLLLTNNLVFSIIYQYFNIEVMANTRMGMNMAFARLKWNF